MVGRERRPGHLFCYESWVVGWCVGEVWSPFFLGEFEADRLCGLVRVVRDFGVGGLG